MAEKAIENANKRKIPYLKIKSRGAFVPRNNPTKVMALIELKDEKIKQRGFRIILGGLSGRRGLSEPISEPLDSESCIRSRATVENGNCLRLCSLLISSRIFCDILVGDIVDTPASANGLN
uniref:Uncharacterized protein n=1 Tax=Glossina pallidipes TaxID=7398 RepID=A0A1A9Z8V6_GLOPL